MKPGKRKAESGMRKKLLWLSRFPLPAFRFPLLMALCAISSACVPREILYPALGQQVPQLRDFPPGFKPPPSNETGEPVHGFGGAGDELRHTPVVFVHGNTVNASFWKPARTHFLKAGYRPNELWALGYGWNSVRAFDSNDLSVPTLDAFMTELQAHLSRQTGREIRQFDIVAHSLGVTLVRQWMLQTNKYHWVRNFVAACGANHGVWTARPDARGQNRLVSFELAPNSPWLAQLNRVGETPGPTRYLTLYDGTGWGDALFPKPYEHSSALQGATNLPYNVKHGTHYDHLELPREPETMDAMIAFFRQAREALPNAQPPQLRREGDVVRSDQPEARVHCTAGERYPGGATPGAAQASVGAQRLTCYARNSRTQLSSALQHYTRAGEAASGKREVEKLRLRAEPAGGVFENPVSASLSVNDPDALIVYTTSGTPPDAGSPPYLGPVQITAPTTLRAVAIAPDGRRSEPLELKFDISLELIDARRTLQHQFDPAAPVNYKSTRKKGN